LSGDGNPCDGRDCVSATPFSSCQCNTCEDKKCSDPPCTGASAALPAAECSAFGDLYDATSGAQWSNCNDSRLDPCG
jgi:hypothetical protein